MMARRGDTKPLCHGAHASVCLARGAPMASQWCQIPSFVPAREPETTAPLSDLEHMVYGVTNQQVTEHGVSFDLGVLDHFRPLEQRRITATVHYDPPSATCTPRVQTTIHGQVAALERIYVQADERLVRPKVRYIDVVGQSLASRPTHVVE